MGDDISDEELPDFQEGERGALGLKVKKDSGEVCSITARECCRWFRQLIEKEEEAVERLRAVVFNKL